MEEQIKKLVDKHKEISEKAKRYYEKCVDVKHLKPCVITQTSLIKER